MLSGELLLDRSFVRGEFVGVAWEKRERVEGELDLAWEWTGRKGGWENVDGWVLNLRILQGFLNLNCRNGRLCEKL